MSLACPMGTSVEKHLCVRDTFSKGWTGMLLDIRVCNEKKNILMWPCSSVRLNFELTILEIRFRCLLLIIIMRQVNCNIFLFTTDSLIHISLDTVVCVVIWELCHKHYRILQQILYSSFSFSEKLKKDILENIKYYYTFAIYIVV